MSGMEVGFFPLSYTGSPYKVAKSPDSPFQYGGRMAGESDMHQIPHMWKIIISAAAAHRALLPSSSFSHNCVHFSSLDLEEDIRLLHKKPHHIGPDKQSFSRWIRGLFDKEIMFLQNVMNMAHIFGFFAIYT